MYSTLYGPFLIRHTELAHAHQSSHIVSLCSEVKKVSLLLVGGLPRAEWEEVITEVRIYSNVSLRRASLKSRVRNRTILVATSKHKLLQKTEGYCHRKARHTLTDKSR